MEIGFWLFMLFCELLIPFVMIVFGGIFSRKTPGTINVWYGYRTALSMKNRDTWEFAHRYIGKLWVRLGWVTLIFSLFPLLLLFGKDVDTVGNASLVLTPIQLIIMVVPIFKTEAALKRTFDQSGRRRPL